jgi:hypothetical protein
MRKRKHRLRRWLGVLGLGFTGQMLPGCLYDSNHVCGDNFVTVGEGDDAHCDCPAGSFSSATGCVKCGAHEVATATACECEPGFSRPGTGMPCAETPAGLGAECDPAAATCSPPYDHCEPSSTSGYCTTTGCATSADCDGGYACSPASVCQRPPVGLNTPCTSPDDCAGTEATFCDAVMTHSCQVQGCSLESDNCFSGFECCDLSMFGVPEPLCVSAGGCLK